MGLRLTDAQRSTPAGIAKRTGRKRSNKSPAWASPGIQWNPNAFAERRVRSVKTKCLWKFILFGEKSLRRAVTGYLEHHCYERKHHAKSKLLFENVETKPSVSAFSNVGGTTIGLGHVHSCGVAAILQRC